MADHKTNVDGKRSSVRNSTGSTGGEKRVSTNEGKKRDSESSKRGSDASRRGSEKRDSAVGGDDDDFEYDYDEAELDNDDDDDEDQEGGDGRESFYDDDDGETKRYSDQRRSTILDADLELIEPEKSEMDAAAARGSKKLSGAGDAIAGFPKKKEMITSLYPEIEDKFHPADVQSIVEKVVREHLEGQPYENEEIPKLIKILTDAIQTKVRTLKYKRYKIITYVSMGERRGEGITTVTRCIWDPISDCMATYTFLNETLFCCVAVYGIYFY